MFSSLDFTRGSILSYETVNFTLYRNILIAGLLCFAVLFSLNLLTFLCLFDTFRAEPVVDVHAENTHKDTLHVVTIHRL